MLKLPLNSVKAVILIASLIVGCGKDDDNDNKVVVNSELLSGYWNEPYYPFGSASDEVLKAKLQNLNHIYFSDKEFSIATNNKEFSCLKPRTYSVDRNIISVDEAEGCKKMQLTVHSLWHENMGVTLSAEGTSAVQVDMFRNNDPARLESLISSMFDESTALDSNFSKFYQQPLEDQVVDEHIEKLKAELPTLKLTIRKTLSPGEIGTVLIDGKEYDHRPDNIESTMCFLTESRTRLTEGFSWTPEKVDVYTPRRSRNHWRLRLSVDRARLRELGYSEEEIMQIETLPSEGVFSTRAIINNYILITDGENSVGCHKPISKGLITLEDIRKAFGDYVLVE